VRKRRIHARGRPTALVDERLKRPGEGWKGLTRGSKRLAGLIVQRRHRPYLKDLVCNLLDSLYQGYPVGYLIAWRNPTVRLKDGTSSAGKRILIDGQQRVTALTASLLGVEVLTKDYETVRIRIAFHPQRSSAREAGRGTATLSTAERCSPICG
jgi:hypothetical protein